MCGQGRPSALLVTIAVSFCPPRGLLLAFNDRPDQVAKDRSLAMIRLASCSLQVLATDRDCYCSGILISGLL